MSNSRGIPLEMVNITSVLLAYIIEAINAITIAMSLPVLYTLTIGPLPFLLAHMVIFTMYSLAAPIPAVGIAFASYQLLYVVKFSAFFAGNPEQLGRLTVIVASVPCWLANFLIILESSWNAEPITVLAAFLCGQLYTNKGRYGHNNIIAGTVADFLTLVFHDLIAFTFTSFWFGTVIEKVRYFFG